MVRSRCSAAIVLFSDCAGRHRLTTSSPSYSQPFFPSIARGIASAVDGTWAGGASGSVTPWPVVKLGGSPNRPRLIESALDSATDRNVRWSLPHCGSLAKKLHPWVGLGNDTSTRLSISAGRMPRPSDTSGAAKKITAQRSANRCRPPWRGLCSVCSLGSHDSCSGGRSVRELRGSVAMRPR